MARSVTGGSRSPLRDVGSWMQTVAAQWLMTSLTSSAVLVGAIQATNLPVLRARDSRWRAGRSGRSQAADHRRSGVMLVSAAGSRDTRRGRRGDTDRAAHSAVRDRVGQGLTGPIAQTLQPELVPPERPQAIALGSVNQNLARAIGPAIGGLLLAATSAALVFFVNSLSFVAVIGAGPLAAVPQRAATLPREHLRSATRAGGRFVRNSPALQGADGPRGRVRVLRDRALGPCCRWSLAGRSDLVPAATACCSGASASAR